MIEVIVVNNSEKVRDIVEGETTLSEVLGKHGIDPAYGTVSFNFAPVKPEQLGKSMVTLTGGEETCYVTNIVKADGGIH